MKRTIFLFLLSLVILYSLKSSISADQFVTDITSNIYDIIDRIEIASDNSIEVHLSLNYHEIRSLSEAELNRIFETIGDSYTINRTNSTKSRPEYYNVYGTV